MITIVDPDGQVGRLLDAAVAVQQAGPASALVGGVAVICRLATAHRPTLDADTIVEQTDTDVLQILRARPQVEPGTDQAVVIEGTPVEIIPIGPVDPETLPRQVDDRRDRLFIAAHRWALDTAHPVQVDTRPSTGARTLTVAIPAGLAATKTHALVGRRGARQNKVGSDLLDVVMLFETFDRDGDLTRELQAAPYDLGGLVTDELGRLLADPQQRTRAIGLTRQAVGAAMSLDRIKAAFGRLLCD